MMQKHANTLWKKYIKIWPKLADFKCPTVIINNRLSATGGYNRSEDNLIHLSGKFMVNNRNEMRNVTLPHELAHQIDFNLNGWAKGQRHHRNSWKMIMIDIGLLPEIYHHMVL